ncbi:MAG: fructose-bisphosphatase class III [Candidatus Saganbacteria bacterium]|nr:fructose-bisphosphatase class III [Candidatus Saganbacteria bacterium]
MRTNGIRPGTERAAMTLKPEYKKRFIDLHRRLRTAPLTLPMGLGRPLALVSTDTHAEVERCLTGLERLPIFDRHIDLGDKLDRGPEPLAATHMLEVTNPPAHRLIGNHDAMWIGAGLGIPRLAIELVRWLMRYNEQNFLVNEMGINLNPLERYAETRFQDARGHYKAKLSTKMEAAATYLKIIAEAPYRFPEHRRTELNESERRVRDALFHHSAAMAFRGGERERFERLTGEDRLETEDELYFYRLMGGLREFTEEEQTVVDHFTRAFQESHAYFQLIECMVGRGDIYTTLRMSEGAPYDMLLTHAGIPITESGDLAVYNGFKGQEAFTALENDIRMAITAWRWFIETGDRALLEADADIIDRLGDLPWGAESPLYMRQMQTAARAVLNEASGLYEEPEGPFFTKWTSSTDPHFVHHVCREISSSFGLDSRRLVIVHGHKPEKKQGAFVVGAGGHDLNIDAGTAKSYGGHGAFLLVGTNGLYKFSLDNHNFSPVNLNIEFFGQGAQARALV